MTIILSKFKKKERNVVTPSKRILKKNPTFAKIKRVRDHEKKLFCEPRPST